MLRAGTSPLLAEQKAQTMAVPSLRSSTAAHRVQQPIPHLPRKVLANQLLSQIVSLAQTGRTSIATKATPTETGVTEKTTNPLDIVFVAAEVAPWSKTGGLGDVVGGLPIELVKRGHRVMTIAPRYDQYYDGWDTSVVINVMGEPVRFFHSVQKGVHRVFVDHPWFLAKVWGKTGSKLYGPKSGADYLDNHKRFSLFCRAAIEAVRVLPFGPGENCVFVANDWHSALVPVLLKEDYKKKGQFTKAKVALCIHNIAFQGRMFPQALKDMGMPQSATSLFDFEDGYYKMYTEATPMKEDEPLAAALDGKMHKKINWLKAGILSADKLLTVSPNYATEISSDGVLGVELDKYIKQAGGIEGIVNGMDIEEWNPKTDKYLPLPYDQITVNAGKAAAKEALQAELGLPVDPTAPLFVFIGRLEEQKGVDIMLKALPKILANGKSQVAILGTGKATFEKQVNTISSTYKGRAKGVVKFSQPLAHLMTAGGDFMLVPSRFEPCGLIQLHAMHYGTVPVVASTGGLVDTVKEGVTGFQMGAFDPEKATEEDIEAIASTCQRASEVYGTPLYRNMVYNCISQDLSWSRPAKKWEGTLEELYLGSGEGKAKKESVVIPIAEKIPGDVPAVTRAPNVAPKQPKLGAVSMGPTKTEGSSVSKPSVGSNGNGNGNGAYKPSVPTPAYSNGNGNGAPKVTTSAPKVTTTAPKTTVTTKAPVKTPVSATR